MGGLAKIPTPRFRTGDMFAARGDKSVILVTANASLNDSGELVMGRGAALQMKQLYPEAPRKFGAAIKARGAAQPSGSSGKRSKPELPPYLVEFLKVRDVRYIGIFQVKRCWWEDADPYIIRASVLKLAEYVKEDRNVTFHLNYPGIGVGTGNLLKEHVRPLLSGLPPNVIVWSRE